MVKWIFGLCLCFICSLNGIEIDPKVLPGQLENTPLTVEVMITSPAAAKIDSTSFELEGKKIQADKVSELKDPHQSNQIISTYRFTIPGKPHGLYVLPAISVKIGNQIVRSAAVSYSVGGTSASSGNTSSYSTEMGSQLKLETIFSAPAEIYPLQRFIVGYRFTFNGNVDLTEEILPLLEAEGLNKIGEKEFHDQQQGNLSILEVTQKVEAEKPGDFSYGPSSIAGKFYVQNAAGRKTYQDKIVRSEIPPIVIKILAFPGEENQPFFTGAVGHFTWNVSLVSSPKVTVGDKIQLKILLKGTGNLADIALPLFGLGRGFREGDIPPSGFVKGDTKEFDLDIWVTSSHVKEIPPLHFAYFDPDAKKMMLLTNKPIPLEVTAPTTSIIEENLKAYRSPLAPIEKVLPVADAAYQESEEAKTLLERQTLLNEALRLYLQAEQQEGLSAHLAYNIGCTLFSLERYPLALAYFRQAQSWEPLNQKISNNISVLRKELETDQAHRGVFALFFSFSERGWMALFCWLGVCVALVAIYFGHSTLLWERIFSIFGIASLVLTMHIAYVYYISPFSGVVIQPTPLFQAPLSQAARLSQRPLLGGAEVQVIQVLDEGNWVKVLTSDGLIGFISGQSLYILD